MTDENADLAWRNLVADWHLSQGIPSCGCDDDTPDGDFCEPSRRWADEQWAGREVKELAGPPDPWNHDIWVAAWGYNAPIVVSPNDFRVPGAPKGMSWLITRMLIRGQKAIEIELVKLGEERFTTLSRSRVEAEPTTVVARSRKMLQDLLS